MFNFWTCSMCFCRSSYFWARAAADGVLSWSMLESWEFQYRRRGCLEFEVSSSSLLQELAEKRRSLEDLSVFEFWPSIWFDLNSFDVLLWFVCLVFFFYCHWASVYVRVFLGMERRQKARFLTPTMSSFFRPRFSYFISVLLCCILEVGEDRFPLGRVCPVLIEEWINVGKLYWCLLATRSQRKCIFP